MVQRLGPSGHRTHRMAVLPPPLNSGGWAERPGAFRGIKRKQKPLGCGEHGLALQSPSQQPIALFPKNAPARFGCKQRKACNNTGVGYGGAVSKCSGGTPV